MTTSAKALSRETSAGCIIYERDYLYKNGKNDCKITNYIYNEVLTWHFWIIRGISSSMQF